MKSLLIVLLAALPLLSFAQTRWVEVDKVKYIYKTSTKSGTILADTTYVTEGKDSLMYTWLKTDTLTYYKRRWTNVNNTRNIMPASIPLIGSGNHPISIYRKVNYVSK